jgi:hypothetical protein
MRADCVELSWDTRKNIWLVRIQVGAEVIRRHYDLSKTADEQALRLAAERTLSDEGYEPDPKEVIIHRY